MVESMLMLLSTLNVIRHMTCGNIYNLLLKLNLIFETLLTGRGNGLLISILEKLKSFRLVGVLTMVLMM